MVSPFRPEMKGFSHFPNVIFHRNNCFVHSLGIEPRRLGILQYRLRNKKEREEEGEGVWVRARKGKWREVTLERERERERG